MLLSDYITDVRDILHDANGNFYTPAQLTRWINIGRKQVAKEGECVRYMPPSVGSVVSITVTNAGTGYSAGTITISAPDATGVTFQTATATPIFGGGLLTGATVTFPGSGYAAVPTVTVTGDGTGATATAVLTPHLTTVLNQEVYSIAAVTALLQSLVPGIGDVLGIQGISVSWGAQKPTLRRTDFSAMQAMLRSWQGGMQGPPAVWAQYGQGSLGTIYLWPVPTQATRMDWDCYCTVQDLVGTTVPDLIPEPWIQPAVFYAAYRAYYNAQRPDDAKTMLMEYARTMQEARAAVSTPMVPSFYGDAF